MNFPASPPAKRARLIIILAALGVLAAVASLFLFRSRGPSYAGFTSRAPAYYGKLAEACDLLLLATPDEAEYEKVFSGSDVVLPSIMRDLRPVRVQVITNAKVVNDSRLLTCVRIQIGESGGGYAVMWSPEATDKADSVWELSASHERERKVLFKMKKFPPSKKPHVQSASR